jgi:hypothetical protein
MRLIPGTKRRANAVKEKPDPFLEFSGGLSCGDSRKLWELLAPVREFNPRASML